MDFVNSFYNFLSAEIIQTNQFSDYYYEIIGEALQKIYFFYHQMHAEQFIIKKVKQWHKLAQDH